MTITNPILNRLTGFIHNLRNQGLRIGIQETIDTIAVISSTTELDYKNTFTILRAMTCQTAEDWQRFDQLFKAYFFPDRVEPVLPAAAHIDPRLRRNSIAGLGGATTENETDNHPFGGGGSTQMTLARADYRFLNDHKAMEEAERIAEQLAHLLKVRPGRKKRFANRGQQLDIRRTLRKNLSAGGTPIHRIFTKRRLDPVSLLVMHDISHSMTWHNPLLYRFVRGLVRVFQRSEAFAFHTLLFRVTELYKDVSVARLKEQLDKQENLGLGGTCIAESIETYLKNWTHLVHSENTIVIILSDGFDTNEPERLSNALSAMRRNYRKLIWLNPMLGRDAYKPDDKSMLAALPYLDLFAPAHSVIALTHAINFIRDAHRSTS